MPAWAARRLSRRWQLRAAADGSLSSHALSPQALLQVYRELHDDEPPPCTLLAIRGLRFELGEPPSAQALAHLEAALQWAQRWLSLPRPAPCLSWRASRCRARLKPDRGRPPPHPRPEP